jgi:hypothetical protein
MLCPCGGGATRPPSASALPLVSPPLRRWAFCARLVTRGQVWPLPYSCFACWPPLASLQSPAALPDQPATPTSRRCRREGWRPALPCLALFFSSPPPPRLSACGEPATASLPFCLPVHPFLDSRSVLACLAPLSCATPFFPLSWRFFPRLPHPAFASSAGAVLPTPALSISPAPCALLDTLSP